MVEKKTSFLYTIHHPCKMQVFMTCNPDVAQGASERGLIVYAKAVGGNIYKHSND